MSHAETAEDLPPLPMPDLSAKLLGPARDYARLRADAPVTKVACPTGLTVWLVTRYDDVREVMEDGERFSSRAGQGGHLVPHMNPAHPPVPGDFTRMDGAELARFRRFLGREVLSRRRLEEIRPIAQTTVDEHLDLLADKGPPADLYNDFAIPVTGRVLIELLGLPGADRRTLHRAAIVTFSTTADDDAFVREAGPAFTYLDKVVRSRAAGRGTDPVSRLIARGGDGPRPFSHAEFTFMLASLLVAGLDTTATAISHGFLAILREPGQYTRLGAEPELVPSAMEELVRCVGGGPGFLRQATRDTEIAGQAIAAGDYIVAAVQSANYDHERFAEPDVFDIRRGAGDHFGFGYGPHQCPGQQVARLELEVILETLPRRVPSLSLAVPLKEIDFRTTAAVPGPVSVPVTWREVLAPGTPPAPR